MANLKLGMDSAAVGTWQENLNKAGANPELAVDDDFGNLTLVATKAFQSANGLTDDGIVGPLTEAKMASVLGATAPIGTTTQANSLGYDVYHGDTMPSLGAIDFLIIKASQGTTETDSAFAARWAEIKAAGKIRGAYHFLDPLADGVAQAQHFWSVVKSLDATDLPPILDFEDDTNTDANLAQRALNFLAEIQKLSGRVPMVYTYPWFRKTYCTNPEFANYPLWYSDLDPSITGALTPWTDWKIWQYNTTSLDEDRFNGSLADLQAYIASSVVSG
jgi:lysozyme